jgi:hypothetical protein
MLIKHWILVITNGDGGKFYGKGLKAFETVQAVTSKRLL